MRIYIYLNFKSNRDIQVKNMTMNRRPCRKNSQDKFSKCIHFVMNNLLFLFSYYHYYLHLCQKIYYFLIFCLNSGTVVPLNAHIDPIWVPYSNGRSTFEP